MVAMFELFNKLLNVTSFKFVSLAKYFLVVFDWNEGWFSVLARCSVKYFEFQPLLLVNLSCVSDWHEG